MKDRWERVVVHQNVGVRSRGDVSLLCTAITSCKEGSHVASWGCEAPVIPQKGTRDIVVIHGDRRAGCVLDLNTAIKGCRHELAPDSGRGLEDARLGSCLVGHLWTFRVMLRHRA